MIDIMIMIMNSNVNVRMPQQMPPLCVCVCVCVFTERHLQLTSNVCVVVCGRHGCLARQPIIPVTRTNVDANFC